MSDITDDYRAGYRLGHDHGWTGRDALWLFMGRPLDYTTGYHVGYQAGKATRRYARTQATHPRKDARVYELLVMTKIMDEPRVMATHHDRAYLLGLRDALNTRAPQTTTWLVYAPGAEQWEEWTTEEIDA
jgi:hypothetical protein